MMVIPPQLGLYMTLAPEEKTLYSVGGPKAQAEFDAGLEGFATRAFRGLGVVMSEPVSVQTLFNAHFRSLRMQAIRLLTPVVPV